MAAALFGWDLLFRSIESEIKNNDDILLCFTHLVLVSNGFKCIGLGDSKTMDGSETKTEVLPKGWNDAYAIRYVYQGRLYNLKATKLDDGIMINLVRVDERTTSLVQLNSSSVASRAGTLDQVLPNHSDMLELIKKQLIDKAVVSRKSREVSSQTPPEPQRQVRSQENAPPMYGGYDPLRVDPRSRPLGVGELDLDPLGGNRNPLGIVPPGGVGGGMLFEPPRFNPHGGPSFGLPPGGIPPGARFDPFRPPGADPRRPPGRNVPDNDEFPPPGYDDMFM